MFFNHKILRSIVFLFLLAFFSRLRAGESQWGVKELLKTPEYRQTDEYPAKDSITPIYYKNGTCRGKDTEVFAWLALPENASVSNKVPGIVIVHGGGGTAYRAWAEVWQKRGYAAIAMDITGGIPQDDDLNSVVCKFVPSELGGPNLNKNFRETKLPFDDQWPVYAVKAIIRAHSILQSLPEVDKKRIGITGISWGAMMGEIAAALDSRFAFAEFVYGCGFMGESSFFKETELDKLPEKERTFWLKHFDASNYIGKIKCPVLFVNGAIDKHFRPDSWGRSVRLLPTKQVWLSYNTSMRHGHLPVCDPPEIAAFADSWAFRKVRLPKMLSLDKHTAIFSVPAGISEATFCWTSDNATWPQCKWQTTSATVKANSVSIQNFPSDARAYFFRIVDTNGLPASTYPVVLEK